LASKKAQKKNSKILPILGERKIPQKEKHQSIYFRAGFWVRGGGEVPLTTKDELDIFHPVSVVLVQKMRWALTKNSEDECNFGCCYLPNSNIIRPDVLKHQPL
jgi:hypothetical protein